MKVYGDPYKLGVVAFFDDCRNTTAFRPKSKVSYLTMKHNIPGGELRAIRAPAEAHAQALWYRVQACRAC
jgi:hypothetical protein